MAAATATRQQLRRLFVHKQRLSAPQPSGILEVMEAIRCLQIDPIQAVARTQELVLWSRLGQYDLAELDRLLWQERALFEFWAHAASIVLTRDYPLFKAGMDEVVTTGWRQRTEAWLAANRGLRAHILEKLTAEGPLPSSAIEDKSDKSWQSTGWTNDRNVGRMLEYMQMEGLVMVAGRSGRARLWDLPERCLPEWTPPPLDRPAAVRQAVIYALRALGAAPARDIKKHFMRDDYPELETILLDLAATGEIEPLAVPNGLQRRDEPWYIHHRDKTLLDDLDGPTWQPRTTLLSPFDNLICDRERTEALFDFRFRIEIYVPKDKREFGYYVLPILHGERLIGRIDPKLDRKTGVLNVHAVYAEAGAPEDEATGRAIGAAIADLAAQVGAQKIQYGRKKPAFWRPFLPKSPAPRAQ